MTSRNTLEAEAAAEDEEERALQPPLARADDDDHDDDEEEEEDAEKEDDMEEDRAENPASAAASTPSWTTRAALHAKAEPAPPLLPLERRGKEESNCGREGSPTSHVPQPARGRLRALMGPLPLP